jgi:hypothetical protein
MAGRSTELSAAIEQVFDREHSAVRRIIRAEDLSAPSWRSPRSSRAILLTRLPSGGGTELRAFRREVGAQALALTRSMTARADILVVAEAPHGIGDDPLRHHRLESILTRMRSAAQQQFASTVSVNALVFTGSVEGPIVAARIHEAIRGRAMPDTDFVILDEDVRDKSIATAIAEECS